MLSEVSVLKAEYAKAFARTAAHNAMAATDETAVTDEETEQLLDEWHDALKKMFKARARDWGDVVIKGSAIEAYFRYCRDDIETNIGIEGIHGVLFAEIVKDIRHVALAEVLAKVAKDGFV